jgi:hypothetical protein
MRAGNHQHLTFTLPPEAWDAARAVVLAADPSETDPDEGVALELSGASGRWLAWSQNVRAATRPDEDLALVGVGGTIVVSRRAVESAAALSDGGGDVEMCIGAAGVSVRGQSLTLYFEHVSRELPAPVATPAPEVGMATAAAGALLGVLEFGRVLPVGVDPRGVALPPFELTIADDRLVAAVDWTVSGAAATRLEIEAETTGAAVADVNPFLVASVVRHADPDEPVDVIIPHGGQWVIVECEHWQACIELLRPAAGSERWEQLVLPFSDTITCHGGLRHDPMPGADVTDVLAYTIDPDVEVRLDAAASRWNWDRRVQLALAADPDERVVLALLDHVDPCREAVDLIAAGPHAEAHRVLRESGLKDGGR